MNLTSPHGDFRSNLQLVAKVLRKLLVIDALVSIIVFFLFGSPDYQNFVSSSNIRNLILTSASVLAITGFIMLILLGFTSQRNASTAIMTSQWGKSSNGPVSYSNEIISRQMQDWPALMAAFVCLFFGLLIMGFLR